MVVYTHNKGLTNIVALIMILIIVVIISLPFLFFYASSQSYKQVSTLIVNNYQYLRDLQIKQVTNGHPTICYKSSTKSSTIVFQYFVNGTFVPSSNLTITDIMYLNQQGVWVSIPLNYPIVISPEQASQSPPYVEYVGLPSNVVGSPIIIITSLGNMFFLTPNSSIGPR